MIHFSTFSGQGGFDLASEWMGWKNYVSCEINPFGRRILEYYWPEAYHHKDIKTLTYATIDSELSSRFGAGWRNDKIILTGGFPCQPYSTAGKRLGKEDDRHLWPEMLRIIREVQPDWVVGENVRGLTNWNGGVVFDEVWSDLENEGYKVLPFLLPACAVDAPHRRDRIWFIAYSNSERHRGRRYRHSITEERSICQSEQKYRDRVWSEVATCGEVASDANSNGYGSNDGFEQIGYPSRKGASIKKEWERIRSIDRRNGAARVAPYTTSKRRKEWIKIRRFKNTKKNRTRMVIRNKRPCSNGFTSNSECKRFERRMRSEQSKTTAFQLASFDTQRTRRGWENFPTQSPLRSGNDGLPTKLDRIAVSSRSGRRLLSEKQSIGRWRNESIKSAGNAIVPQLVYQIFKAIQQYEDSLNGIPKN